MTPEAQNVWRAGVAPLLSLGALDALRRALAEDDERLVQGTTTVPLYLPSCTAGDPVERACPLGLCCWHDACGVGLTVAVREIDDRFGDLLAGADHRLGFPGASSPLINWIDQAGRDELRAGLLVEVRRELEERRADGDADPGGRPARGRPAPRP